MTIILMGVSGCGKTKIGEMLSAQLHLPFFDGDSFHSAPNIDKMRSGIPLNDEDRKPWLNTLRAHIAGQEKKGGSILACSALKKAYRVILDNQENHNVIFVHLKGTRELIARRLANRDNHYMPAELLNSQFAALEEPKGGITISIDQPPEVVVKDILGKINRQK
ncbi:MAG: gluconokinase [Balneolales bacterium]